MERHDSKTRLRLLKAAGEIFSKKGFRAATIREICAKAGANVAAVNYHFGDKGGLYMAVLDAIMRDAFDSHPMGLSEQGGIEEQLKYFVRTLLKRIFHTGDSKDPEGEGRLVAYAMSAPSPALDVLVERYVKPMSAELRAILAGLLDVDVEHGAVWLCAKSIVGQCMHYLYGSALMKRLGAMEDNTEGIEQIIEHIVRFSLGGIRHISEGLRS